MTTPITVTNPKELNLTKRELLANGREPYYLGTTWIVRMQVRDENNAAKSLQGATIVLTISDGTTTVERKTGVASAGAPANQIVLDADQNNEIADPGTGTYSGKGWFQFRFDPVAADFNAMNPFGGKIVSYDIGLKFGDAVTQKEFVEGKLEVCKTKTTFPIP